MGLEKDTLHVVIRLPFKRPKGFIEPPSVEYFILNIKIESPLTYSFL
jgi:hypothetical protein